MELLLSGVLFMLIGGLVVIFVLLDVRRSGWVFELYELGILIIGLAFISWGFYIIPDIVQVV